LVEVLMYVEAGGVGQSQLLLRIHEKAASSVVVQGFQQVIL